jgi:hypothetical protein
MKSIAEKTPNMQGTNDYGVDCRTGKELAVQFLSDLINRINSPDYDGLERNKLGDTLFGHNISGVQVGFCYELLRQIEPVLVKH